MKEKRVFLYPNESVERVLAFIPPGHMHVRFVLELADRVLVLQEASVAGIVRAFAATALHPSRRAVELVSKRIPGRERKHGFAEWQLVESEKSEEEVVEEALGFYRAAEIVYPGAGSGSEGGAVGVEGFVSRRASIGSNVFIHPGSRIYGPSVIGSGSIVDCCATIGYPVRRRLLGVTASGSSGDEALDGVSSGARLGEGVVVRRGSVVYEEAVLGPGVELGHNVLVREKVVVGRGSKIGSNTVLDADVVIGENTSIQSMVYIPARVRVGSNVFIGPRAVFTNDRYPASRRLVETVVEDEAVIGANATIVAGIVIGRGAVVAAGAVVTKSVEPYTVVAGVPARPIGRREEYEEKKKSYEEGREFPLA